PEASPLSLHDALPIYVVMTDPDGRILLCKTTFKKDWELPGGIVEPGESPVLAASREVAEEIGIDLRVGRLLAMDWLPPYLGWSEDRKSTRLNSSHVSI